MDLEKLKKIEEEERRDKDYESDDEHYWYFIISIFQIICEYMFMFIKHYLL